MVQRSSTEVGRSLGEVAVLLGAFFIDQWVLRSFSNPVFELPALGVVVAVFVISIKRRGGLERILQHPVYSARRAWLETIAATAIPAVGLVAWGLMVRGSYDELPLKITQAGALGLLAWIGQHLMWATLQQGLLQLFLRPVVGEIFKKSTVATLVTAFIFGLLHLPCLAFAVSTMFLGAMWIVLFSRHRRIMPIVVSHAMLSAITFVALPPQWNCELNVGVIALKRQPEYHVLRLQETRKKMERVTSDAYFKSSGGTNRDFIKSLYRDMLRRTPADTEVKHWLDRMDQGFSRNRVVIAFARSSEFRTQVFNTSGTEKGPQ